MKKICSKCKIEKNLELFYSDISRIDGKSCYCISCSTLKDKINRDKYKEKIKERKRIYDKNNYSKDKNKDKYLKSHFGISLDEYKAKQKQQNDLCAICNRPETTLTNEGQIRQLAVDHCHKTNKVRGLLCRKCNVSLGNAEENILTLYAQIAYLEKHKQI